MEEIQSFKVHQIVEHLKTREDFAADTEDLEDKGVKGLLQDYDIFVSLSSQEEDLARAEIYALCEQNEFREVSHLVFAEEEAVWISAGIPASRSSRFNERVEKARRNVILSEVLSRSP